MRIVVTHWAATRQPSFAIIEILGNWKVHKRIKLNVFRLVSDVYRRENLHSDIIGALLEPETHRESICLLIQFLNRCGPHGLALDPARYGDACVDRERLRTDILVQSPKNTCCIIIENKINDAGDRDGQLSKYFTVAQGKKLKPEAVVYLSKDGKPPTDRAFQKSNRAEVEKVLVPLCAFGNDNRNLVTGWLWPLLEASTDDDLKHLLLQYIDILKEIGEHAMNADTEDKFLEWLKESDANYQRAQILVSLYNDRFRVVLRQITAKYDGAEFRRRYNILETKVYPSHGWTGQIVIRASTDATIIVEVCELKGNIGLMKYPAGDPASQLLHSTLKTGLIEIVSGPIDVYKEFTWPKEEAELKNRIERLLEFLQGQSTRLPAPTR